MRAGKRSGTIPLVPSQERPVLCNNLWHVYFLNNSLQSSPGTEFFLRPRYTAKEHAARTLLKKKKTRFENYQAALSHKRLIFSSPAKFKICNYRQMFYNGGSSIGDAPNINTILINSVVWRVNMLHGF